MPIPVLVSNERRNTYHGLEDASQTWIEGDFVTLDATTGETRLFAFDSDTLLLGLAQKAASGTTGTDAPVSQIWPGDIIALDTYKSSGTPGAYDASQFVPGKLYELLMTGSGATKRWWAEFAGTHSGGLSCLICEGIVQDTLRKKLEGTTRTRALFRFLDSVLLQHVGQ
ncbi:MAG: hypothetical protein ACYSW8_32925 [Planctomycetota bacterium]|jgi:hypothetical protein